MGQVRAGAGHAGSVRTGQVTAGQVTAGQARVARGRIGPDDASQPPDAPDTSDGSSDGPGRPPTAAEAEEITAAVLGSPLLSAVPVDGLRVSGIRTSRGAPDWAFAMLSPSDGNDPSIAVLRWDTCGGWVLDQVGAARVSPRPAGRRDVSTAPASAATAGAARRPGGAVRRGCESGVRPGDAARPG